ncbi:MAG TPA: hypothetical protein VLJ60_06385 [bacterium]|nr:hypothetical protein [bacterium]
MKPQDILVLFKLLISGGRSVPYSEFAKEIFLSTSELHASIRRLEKNGLFSTDTNRVVISCLKEFIFHGAKYVFPVELGMITRGIPTSFGAEPLKSEFSQSDTEIPVWPDAEGTHRGVSFSPIYKTACDAAKKDEKLYRLLALFDALRSGRARERNVAKELIEHEIDLYAEN